MAEGTLAPATDQLQISTFQVEYTHSLQTGRFRTSIKFSDFPRVSTLRSLFASVRLRSVVAEVRQDADIADGGVALGGHVFVAVIPTCKDSDAATGASNLVVSNVPNKQTFPLSSSTQSNEVFNFNLGGFEVDLAQDPRRGAGPVAWIGNSGITKQGDSNVSICTVTWRITVDCSGHTPNWQ
jgi:hypothetical protein